MKPSATKEKVLSSISAKDRLILLAYFFVIFLVLYLGAFYYEYKNLESSSNILHRLMNINTHIDALVRATKYFFFGLAAAILYEIFVREKKRK